MCFKWNQVEILALKSKTMQIKNPVEVFKIGFELAKIGITNLKSTEMSHLRNRKKKGMKEQEQCSRALSRGVHECVQHTR